MKTIIFLLAISFIGSIYGQIDKTDKISNDHIRFYQDFLNFAEGNKTRLDVFIRVPFREIQFVKSGTGYEGGYSVTVSEYPPS